MDAWLRPKESLMGRTILFSALVSTLLLTGLTAPAQAQGRGRSANQQVDQWYRQYLGRPVDQAGLDRWANELRNGTAWQEVLGGILGSREYFRLKGGTYSRFIQGLYLDVLGRAPSRLEMRNAMDRLDQSYFDWKEAENERASFATDLLERMP
jgi:hypothetical protein